MGNSGTRPPSAVKKPGTTLVELEIAHVRDAHDIIGQTPHDYSPVTLVPGTSLQVWCGCTCFWAEIPDGFRTLVSKFGEDLKGDNEDETWKAGAQWCFCCNRVSRMVTEQLVIFDTPVQAVKTKDNIDVSIDVLIVFEVIEAKKFCYHLGPSKLDSLLRATQEEVIRQLAYETNVVDIYDLHGADTSKYVEEMNKQFSSFGVAIHNFIVQNVKIPEAMAKDFEEATLYAAKTREQEMLQEQNKLHMNNEEALLRLKEENANKEMAAEEQTITMKAQLQKETKEVVASTSKEIALYEAETQAQVQEILATAELEVAKIQAEVLLTKRGMEADVHEKIQLIEAKAEGHEIKKFSEGVKERAAKVSDGRKEMAVQEGAAAAAFAPRRYQEQEMKRLQILEGICANEGMCIATTTENTMGLAQDNSLVNQVAQQGLEAFRMKLAEITAMAANKLNYSTKNQGGLVRPIPAQQAM